MEKSPANTQTTLHISEEVVSTVAREAIHEVEGVARLANLPVKASVFMAPSAARPVRILLNTDVAEVEVGIVVRWNYRLKDVCEQVQAAVKDSVQNMTGVAVAKVNVHVAGVQVKDE